MSDANLYTRLSRKFLDDPSRVFARGPGERTVTYGELDDLSARFAEALRELGVRPGDRVAVQVEKSIEAFLLYLGTLRAGAIFLPLNSAYTASEIAYFLGDARPALFITAPEKAGVMADAAAKAGARVETLGSPSSADPGSLMAKLPERADGEITRCAPDDLASILYTSGTTGRAKGAMITHENLHSNAVVLADYWRFTAEDVLLHALPIFHIHGLFTACNTMLARGASLIWLPRFDLGEIIRLLPEATAMMGVPTFYTRLLDDPRFTREITRHVRLFTSGSAPLLEETHRQFFDRTGQAILERYGMTETQMSTSNPYEGERRPGTVGFALPGVDLRVTEPESGTPVAPGAVGMIEVKGPNVFKGYWQMPEKTREEFRADGFFITGDLGRIDGDGYVQIVGRARDLVISGGYNVYPKEVEEVIDALPGVLESAVIGVPHQDLGEAVVAIVVPEAGVALTEEEIIGQLGTLARFKQPRRVIIAEALPRNTMGKVQKKDLREEHAALFARASGGEGR